MSNTGNTNSNTKIAVVGGGLVLLFDNDDLDLSLFDVCLFFLI